MSKKTLYNGKLLPDYVFGGNDLHYLFFEFDFIFTNGFWKILVPYLEAHSISRLALEDKNLKQGSFYKEVPVKNFQALFNENTYKVGPLGGFSLKTAIYMVTDRALLFAPEDPRLFCLFLDRNYWLCLFATTDRDSLRVFKSHCIKNPAEYLSTHFTGDSLPDNFLEKLKANYKW